MCRKSWFFRCPIAPLTGHRQAAQGGTAPPERKYQTAQEENAPPEGDNQPAQEGNAPPESNYQAAQVETTPPDGDREDRERRFDYLVRNGEIESAREVGADDAPPAREAARHRSSAREADGRVDARRVRSARQCAAADGPSL